MSPLVEGPGDEGFVVDGICVYKGRFWYLSEIENHDGEKYFLFSSMAACVIHFLRSVCTATLPTQSLNFWGNPMSLILA